VYGLETLCNLFFELSSEERLRILHKLDEVPMNVTSLSRELKLTTQESSRHVSRLSEAGLTQKDPDGLNHLTPYGRLILRQIEGLDFASQYSDYFVSHSVARLPAEFVDRIGDLADSTYVDDLSDIFYRIDRMIQGAEEYVCTITDQYLMSTYPLFKEALERDVKLKNLEIKDWVVSPEMKQGYFSNEEPWVAIRRAVNEARVTGLLEERMLESLDVFLYMSEKEVAGVAFPLPNGKFDYLGFSARSERAHKWCRDLFQYYWDKARSRQTLVEELHKWIMKRPDAIRVLKDVAAGKRATHARELLSELQSKWLVKDGELTIIGDLVSTQLQE
jgi:predicted transcriptional regulator